MPLGGINPGAKTKGRIRYNWARITKGAEATSLRLNPPLTVDQNGNLSIGIGSGLTLGGGNITVVVDNSTLSISNNTLQIKNGGVGLTQIGALTAKGQLLTFSTVTALLTVGTNGQVLTANSTASTGLSWNTPFSNPMTTSGDIIFENGTLPSRLPIGTSNQVLTVVGGIPAWVTPVAGSNGTVTSVGVVVPSILTVSGSPVTSAGTITIGLANEVANKVFAGPTSGANATPAFRSLVAADIPTTLSNSTILSIISDVIDVNNSVLTDFLYIKDGGGGYIQGDDIMIGDVEEEFNGTFLEIDSFGAVFNFENGDLGIGGNSIAGLATTSWNNGASIVAGTGTGLKIATSTSQKLGFWGATPVIRQTLTGSRTTGAALLSIIAAGVAMGLWTDSTTT